MDEGFPEATSAVIVYGPDGKMYSDPLTARRAGVTNYTMEPPAGVPVTPISPRDSSVPFNPSSEEQRKYFNQFADAFSAYQAPNLAARAPAFTGYGYEAPTTNMVMAPQQMPQLMLDPNAIYDPTVGAALQIMNRPMMIGQMPSLMGDGTDYQRQYSLLRDIAPVKSQQYQRMADPVSLMDSISNGGGGDGNYEFSYNQFPLGSDAPESLSYENQNRDLVEAGWDPMGYNENAPSLSGFEWSPGDPTVYSQDTGYDI